MKAFNTINGNDIIITFRRKALPPIASIDITVKFSGIDLIIKPPPTNIIVLIKIM